MKTTTLSELPPPPAGRTGWPWTETTPPLPDTMPNGEAWPRISIVTPSFNQGHFIEETIRSILLQGYPNLEYIIIDGGSTDESVEIIKKYEPWLTYWVSEKDSGQAHAINKGLERCTGEIFNWINSDDFLTLGALKIIAESFGENDAVAGGVQDFGIEEKLTLNMNLSAIGLINSSPTCIFHQPGLWLRRECISLCGGIDESFQYLFDPDLVIRYLYLYPNVNYFTFPVVNFRLHQDSKTVSQKAGFQNEWSILLRKLQNRDKFRCLHRVCRDRLRLYEWWDLLKRLSERPGGRFSRVLLIVINSCFDPKIRWSRYSLGTIRQVI